jgi:rare lipoprotein A
LQWGCSGPSPYVRSDGGPSTAVPAENANAASSARADRGNPPFYDVLGKRYHVLSSSEGYRARGVASWYGRDFHGLATSSGETYNMNAMTAAHTTLPIPTWVEVTNLANGKHAIVKVNDRGPFVDNRLIDLSYAAALKLDMVRNGTARVEVRALDAAPGDVPATLTVSAPPGAVVPRPGAEPPSEPGGLGAGLPPLLGPRVAEAAPLAVPAVPSAVLGEMFIQVGAFSDRGNAVRLVERLRVNGFTNAFVAADGDGRKVLHRVRLGPLADAREFDQTRARLRSLGFGESQLVTAR